jgi:hypothetical protein
MAAVGARTVRVAQKPRNVEPTGLAQILLLAIKMFSLNLVHEVSILSFYHKNGSETVDETA